MYNMYSWNQAARASDEHADTQPTKTQAARSGQARRASRSGQARSVPAAPGQPSAATRHAQAVQFSLDRRDNGGDAGRTR